MSAPRSIRLVPGSVAALVVALEVRWAGFRTPPTCPQDRLGLDGGRHRSVPDIGRHAVGADRSFRGTTRAAVPSLVSEGNASRAGECTPHGHRLVVGCDLSLVLDLVVLQVFAYHAGVDGVVVWTCELRVGVQDD